MRDVSESFIPLDAAVDPGTHAAFIEAMAALHTHFWQDVPDADLMDFAGVYSMLTPQRAVIERDELGDRSDVLRAVTSGWVDYASSYPHTWEQLQPLLVDAAPLVAAYADTPTTLLQGDWKMGNLGIHADGSVVLVDWDRTSEGPGAYELAWYLAVNCDRLPESKEATIDRYRGALEAGGVHTDGWWDRQLDLALLGGLLQLGWSKTGQPEEIGWWNEQAQHALRLL
jgi:hypothetical protein